MNSPAINELGLEGSVYALFAEFLAALFDGGTHDAGGNRAVQFTAAVVRFGQSAVPQPLRGASITMVLSAGHARLAWENVPTEYPEQLPYRNPGGYDDAQTVTRQQMAYLQVRLNFWVRAEEQAREGENARELCLKTCDLLHGVLSNAAAVRCLAQKGVKRLRPGAPQPVSETNYSLRLLPVTATLRYPVRSQV